MLPESATPESSGLRTFTASAKLTQKEFLGVQQRATRTGKRLGDWCREVLLRELSGDAVPDILLAEVFGLRMILLNILGAFARGEKLSMEELQKLIAQVDAQKMKRALERTHETRSPQQGGR